MPFDSTKLRQPTITVLRQHRPNVATAHGISALRLRLSTGGTMRRGVASASGHGLLLFVLLVLAAHADQGGIHYDHWQDTDGQ